MPRPIVAIYLLSTTITQDELKNQIQTPVERQVFAEELAVFASDYYSAAAAGLRPERMWEVYTREYRGEAKVKHLGITYRVIRTSLGKTAEKTRLTCEKVTGNA